MFGLNRVVGRSNQPITLVARAAHYQINQKGEKVVVSKRVNILTEREKWQKVPHMGKEPELRKIQQIERNERLHADANVAKVTADSKLQQLRDRLLLSGFCREKKSYNPPTDVESKLNAVCQEVFKDTSDEQAFNDQAKKFKFLVRCHQEFDHEVSNSDLHLMKTVADVKEYYRTPVRGTNSYNQMVQNQQNLPPNLHVIPEPIRFNPETDTFFKGISAYPGYASELTGLRAKKKYPAYKKEFEWPDV